MRDFFTWTTEYFSLPEYFWFWYFTIGMFFSIYLAFGVVLLGKKFTLLEKILAWVSFPYSGAYLLVSFLIDCAEYIYHRLPKFLANRPKS